MAMYEERCLHSDVCKYGKNRTNGVYCSGERCLHFIDRTKWADGVKTNADRIRAMSDEELAEYIDSVAESCYNAGAEDLPLSNSNPLSNAYNILEWLQQPAEGE